MTDLAAWLLERIADDETAARASADRSPIYPHYGDTAHEETWIMGVNEGTTEEAAAHIARWDPARVLAECAAKRRIVELHGGEHDVCLNLDGVNKIGVNGDCGVMLLLAAPYSDHPSFDPAWETT